MQEDEKRDHLIAYCTCPPGDATEIARKLVREKVCACVNIVPGIQSVYLWKGKVEEEPEALLVIKTRSDRFAALHDAVAKVHPYEVFELVAARVDRGNAAYLDWIDECFGEGV